MLWCCAAWAIAIGIHRCQATLNIKGGQSMATADSCQAMSVFNGGHNLAAAAIVVRQCQDNDGQNLAAAAVVVRLCQTSEVGKIWNQWRAPSVVHVHLYGTTCDHLNTSALEVENGVLQTGIIRFRHQTMTDSKQFANWPPSGLQNRQGNMDAIQACVVSTITTGQWMVSGGRQD